MFQEHLPIIDAISAAFIKEPSRNLCNIFVNPEATIWKLINFRKYSTEWETLCLETSPADFKFHLVCCFFTLFLLQGFVEAAGRKMSLKISLAATTLDFQERKKNPNESCLRNYISYLHLRLKKNHEILKIAFRHAWVVMADTDNQAETLLPITSCLPPELAP